MSVRVQPQPVVRPATALQAPSTPSPAALPTTPAAPIKADAYQATAAPAQAPSAAMSSNVPRTLAGSAQFLVKTAALAAAPAASGGAKTTLPDGDFDLTRYVSDDAARAAIRSRYDNFPGLWDKLAGEVDAVKAANPAFKDIPAEDLVALRAYTKSSYDAINRSLRGLDGPEQMERMAMLIKGAASALSQLPPFQGPVFRRAGLNDVTGASYEPGKVVTEKAFASTSTVNSSKFMGNTLFSIESRKTGRLVEAISDHPDEHEVLFPPGTRFKVLSNDVDAATQQRLVTMVEVE